MDKSDELNEMAKIIMSKMNTGTYDNAFDDSGDAAVALQEAGYRKIIPLRDFIVTAGELAEMRERACNDARKKTAREILQELYDEAKNQDDHRITISTAVIKDVANRHYGVEVDE